MDCARGATSCLLVAMAVTLMLTTSTRGVAENKPVAGVRDGQHDFDFGIGTFKSHIRRLQHPLTGSTTSTETDAVISTRKLWNGLASLEEVEADTPNGHLQGLTLRLYNPKAHQWMLHWANGNDGVLARTPSVGAFHDGRGEFYDHELLKGRGILVRQIYSDITADSYHFEQAFSDDDGKTWEPNWVAVVTRVAAQPSTPAVTAPDRNRDFDFNFGTWKTHVSRLRSPLTGMKRGWVQYEGTAAVTPVWNGRASVFELNVNGPAGRIQGMGLRLYNPESHQWSLNWANSADGLVGTPMLGEFKQGQGQFMDMETFADWIILARNGFSEITRTSSRFEQGFSVDGGRSWETNWVMTFKK